MAHNLTTSGRPGALHSRCPNFYSFQEDPWIYRKRKKEPILLNFHSSKIAEIYPSPGLQKSRLLFCKHLVSLGERRWHESREGSWLSGASERSRGQAKVKPKAPGLEGGRRSRQSWGQGAPQHKSLRSLLASSPRRQVSLRKGIRGLPEIFRHGSVAQDLRVCGKVQLKSFYCPEKFNTARSLMLVE